MARARKSHDLDEEKAKTKLQPAWGKCGDNPYVIYCDLTRDGDEYPRILVKNFKAKYAAKYMLTKLTHNDTWEECDPIGSRRGIITSGGVRITMSGDSLFMLLDYEPTGAELEWRDEQTEKHVLQFKYGSSEGAKRRDEDQDGSGGHDPEVSQRESDANPPRDKHGDRSKRQPREPKSRVDTSGYVSANNIAAELKVEGREVRGVLRSLKLEKPAHGWSWPKVEAEKIKEKVRAALKEAKTKKR